MSCSRPCSSRGFTIVEAVIVLAVLSILVAVTGPGMSAMVVTQQLKNASFDLSSSLALARSEALTQNIAVTIAPAEDDWARGWTVTAAGGRVLRRQGAYGRIALAGPVRITFSGDGRPDTTATPFAVTAPDADTTLHRCVRMRLNGRAYVTKGAC